MPELADVEVIRQRLQSALRGATIASAQSRDRRILRPQTPRSFSRALTGRKVRSIARRGKWLRIELDDGFRLFSHLGMTGWWVERELDAPKQTSERARLDLTRGARATSLRYLDSRRFGRLIASQDDIAQWRALGPDPLVDGIDVKALAAALARSRRAVKDAVMDQSILAGIGNILATEALWHARIDPRSSSDALPRADVGKLARGLGTALRRELSAREGATGPDEWQDVFAVYGRTGQPCPRDGSTLARVRIGGRTTTFCKTCQILRKKSARRLTRARPRTS